MFLTIASCKTQNWSFPIKFVFLIANQKTQLIQRCNHNDIDIYHLMCPAFLSQLWLTLWLSPSPPHTNFLSQLKSWLHLRVTLEFWCQNIAPWPRTCAQPSIITKNVDTKTLGWAPQDDTDIFGRIFAIMKNDCSSLGGNWLKLFNG